ncbi:DNA-directed RNA polymerase subunit K [Thermogymnomonas acidicola]|uniref:DNA-directed RNA polymerase subunit K n=1 Tax=Thermogymnomonas acidicola TaxID=399579 RepID=UPI000946387F|nr:DNA-directed RNA polymerase subunit K [Thermogymnomonas acidicola]
MTLTKFEKARIIGARALQISMGAPPVLIDVPSGMVDPVDIAMLEFENNLIPPITIKRNIPSSQESGK